jgi:hypothetical protein
MKRRYAISMMATAAVLVLVLAGLAFAAGDTPQIKNKEGVGNYLTDGKGMTLYYFKKDQPDRNACTGPCLENGLSTMLSRSRPLLDPMPRISANSRDLTARSRPPSRTGRFTISRTTRPRRHQWPGREGPLVRHRSRFHFPLLLTVSRNEHAYGRGPSLVPALIVLKICQGRVDFIRGRPGGRFMSLLVCQTS